LSLPTLTNMAFGAFSANSAQDASVIDVEELSLKPSISEATHLRCHVDEGVVVADLFGHSDPPIEPDSQLYLRVRSSLRLLRADHEAGH
jgi:hypothetical protein